MLKLRVEPYEDGVVVRVQGELHYGSVWGTRVTRKPSLDAPQEVEELTVLRQDSIVAILRGVVTDERGCPRCLGKRVC